MPDDLGMSIQPPVPPGAAQSMMYRQGVVAYWNPVTLQNRVLIGDPPTEMIDLAVLGVGESAALREGAVVGIAVVGDTWAIIGRMVTPNTPEATDAITLLGQRTRAALVSTQESTSSGSYTDLTTLGPFVNGVRVPASGKVYVLLSAFIIGTMGGSMSVEVTGDVSISPSTTRALQVEVEPAHAQVALSASRGVLFEGLPAGVMVNFIAKYLSFAVGACEFRDREITVQQL